MLPFRWATVLSVLQCWMHPAHVLLSVLFLRLHLLVWFQNGQQQQQLLLQRRASEEKVVMVVTVILLRKDLADCRAASREISNNVSARHSLQEQK